MLTKTIEKIHNFLKIISLIFLVSGLILLFGGVIIYPFIVDGSVIPVGKYMVMTEIHIIPHIIYLKPITLTVILLFLGYAAGIEYVDSIGGIKSAKTSSIIFIISSLFTFISFYELLFNFMLWGALISSISLDGTVQGNIDILINTFPNPYQSWNLVFATKMFTLLFFVSILTLIYSIKWKKS